MNLVSQKACQVSISFFVYTHYLHIFYKSVASFEQWCILRFLRQISEKTTDKLLRYDNS